MKINQWSSNQKNTASGFNWSSSFRSQMQLTLIDGCCLCLEFIYSMPFDNLQDNYTRIIDTEWNFDLDTYSKTNRGWIFHIENININSYTIKYFWAWRSYKMIVLCKVVYYILYSITCLIQSIQLCFFDI